MPGKSTLVEPARGSAVTPATQPPIPANPAYSPGVTATMARDVEFIVERLAGPWLSDADQHAIVARIEPYLHADETLEDLYPGATHYLDRFLLLLKSKPYQRAGIATLFQTQHAIVFDDLWRRLEGDSLTRFREIVSVSRSQAAGPGRPTYESALATVVAPAFWRVTALLSFGVVTPSLFDAMHAAVAAGSRPGGSVFMHQLGVALGAGFDFLTLGTVRAAYEGAVAYAERHPDCSMRDIRRAGLLAAADVVLPTPEIKLIAQWVGILDTEKGELPPDMARAIQAFFEAALKTILLGVIIKVKLREGRARSEIHEELTGTRGRADQARRVTLFHGGSEKGIASVREGVRIDVNSAHPGRRQWGRGFYLGDEAAAQRYAQQTGSPAVVEFRGVHLDELGTVVDLTTGPGKRRWDAFMNEKSGNLRNRELWQIAEEQREKFFEEFLMREGIDPDVVVAPHERTGSQVVIRTRRAAATLNRYLEGP